MTAAFAIKEALRNKGFEGDRNVYEARIKADEKVQDIATKAVTGAAKFVMPSTAVTKPK